MKVGVLGAGAMGTGIAQVAAMQGHDVVIADTDHSAIVRSRDAAEKAIARDVEKGRLERQAADGVRSRLTFADRASPEDLGVFHGCGIVIEAIVERLEVKQRAFQALDQSVDESCILATNTSSLSIASIAAACRRPERLIGLHFFNPPTVLPLVEIIPGLRTDATVTSRVTELARAWKKTPVVAADTPGFIVNRIARPFYGEAIRLLEEGAADVVTIDWAMTELGGFKMGPFTLMDFIGHDVNFAVTRSVYEAMFFDARYRPSHTQQRLVEAGLLGRKAGRGFYDYAPGTVQPEPVRDHALGRAIVDRIVAMLINEAVDALNYRIASAEDIEVAMTKGVNYPKGLLAWCDDVGTATVLERLDWLSNEYREDRYRASPLLRRMARDGARFLS